MSPALNAFGIPSEPNANDTEEERALRYAASEGRLPGSTKFERERARRLLTAMAEREGAKL